MSTWTDYSLTLAPQDPERQKRLGKPSLGPGVVLVSGGMKKFAAEVLWPCWSSEACELRPQPPTQLQIYNFLALK